MGENKGKPSGKFAEDKGDPGREGLYKRSKWPEDAHTQRVESGEGMQQGKHTDKLDPDMDREGRGRNRNPSTPD